MILKRSLRKSKRSLHKPRKCPKRAKSSLKNYENIQRINSNKNSSTEKQKICDDQYISKNVDLSKLKCQNCSNLLKDYEVYKPSSCDHNFCSNCLELSKNNNIYSCVVCHREFYWYSQTITGHRFFLGDFDSLRATLVEIINHSIPLIEEFQNFIISNYSDVKNHYTEMLTKLYVALKSLQSSVVWDELQLYKINITEEDISIMTELYNALTLISKCKFDDLTGNEKPNIIDDMIDSIPFIIWLRKHLLTLHRFIDSSILEEKSLQSLTFLV